MEEESITELARRVTRYFQAAQECIQRGDWVKYGQYQEKLQKAILEMSEALGYPLRTLDVWVVSPLTLGGESLDAVLLYGKELDDSTVMVLKFLNNG